MIGNCPKQRETQKPLVHRSFYGGRAGSETIVPQDEIRNRCLLISGSQVRALVRPPLPAGLVDAPSEVQAPQRQGLARRWLACVLYRIGMRVEMIGQSLIGVRNMQHGRSCGSAVHSCGSAADLLRAIPQAGGSCRTVVVASGGLHSRNPEPIDSAQLQVWAIVPGFRNNRVRIGASGN